MKGRYGKLAKTLVTLILAIAAFLMGLCGMRVAQGKMLGMSFSEIRREISYEQSNNAAVYIFREGDKILASFELAEQFTDDGAEETNAQLYLRDSVTGEVLTNVEAWRSLSAEEVQRQYEEDCGDRFPVYYQCEGDVQGENFLYTYSGHDTLRTLGESLAEEVAQTFGTQYNQIFLSLDTSYPMKSSDSYRMMEMYEWWKSYPLLRGVDKVVVFFVSLAVVALMLVLASCQTGHRKQEDGAITAVPVDRFPIEIMIAGDVILWIFVTHLIIRMLGATSWRLYYDVDLTDNLVRFMYIGTVAVVMAVLLLAWELKRYGRRIKEHAIGGSLIRHLIEKRASSTEESRRDEKENRRTAARYLLFVALQFALCFAAGMLSAAWALKLVVVLVVLLVALDVFVLWRLLKNARERSVIREGMRRISEGDLDYRMDEEKLSGDNRTMAQELNRVRDGISLAVEKEVKSERLKTDLITNVSHDIKTPLTSIINYVDILKRENISDDKIAGYIDILDRKTKRLKQLTDDLIEASKISSGNIILDMRDLNFKELILQAVGELDEKFQERNLQTVIDLAEQEMWIHADGRQMYRVVENLLGNAAKYAASSSRVYIDGVVENEKVIFSVKNISDQPLNMSADELMERFVRGDIARTTEGSGLGLEIAKNLTSLQGGNLELYLDGDLFRVTVTFDSVPLTKRERE